MKATIVRLRRLARSHAGQRALSELALVYVDVAVVSVTLLEWDRIEPDRINTPWQALLLLARLIQGIGSRTAPPVPPMAWLSCLT